MQTLVHNYFFESLVMLCSYKMNLGVRVTGIRVSSPIGIL